LLGVNIEFLGKMEISQSPLPDVWDFCVTDDEMVIIPDYRAGNLKIYGKIIDNEKESLRQEKIIGQRGYGPDEFLRPTLCYYDEVGEKLAVMDHGIRKILIYDRIGRTYFKRVQEIACWRGAFDIQLTGERLFISGYASDSEKRNYDFYYVDLINEETTYLLPSYLKFGLKSSLEFEKKVIEADEISAIGLKGLFALHKDVAYFLWEGNLKVIKLNILSGNIEQKTFGKQPPHYIKPFVSNKLVEYYRMDKKLELNKSEKAKMSYVRDIFVNDRYVMIIYEGPVKQNNASNFRIQFYTLDGDFIKEEFMSETPTHKMWFDKNKSILYFLSCKTGGESGQSYSILKYQIHE
jgi:hypothetical protein